jgi:hypothetical protein
MSPPKARMHLPAPPLPEASKEAPSSEVPFEGFGFKMPLPRWAASILACLILLGVVLMLYKKFGRDLVSPAETGEQAEYVKHFIESREIPVEKFVRSFADPARGDLQVSYYESDGCVLLLRRPPHATPSMHWVKYFSGIGAGAAAPDPSPDARTPTLDGPIASAGLAFPRPPTIATGAGACTGQCQNPHPGNFQSWNGERKQCWVQVWRRWPDGCVHYQWFNSCTNYWDSDQGEIPGFIGPAVSISCDGTGPRGEGGA